MNARHRPRARRLDPARCARGERGSGAGARTASAAARCRRRTCVCPVTFARASTRRRGLADDVHDRSDRGFDRLDNLLVAGAPAEISRQRLADLIARGMRRSVEQRLGGDEESRACSSRTAPRRGRRMSPEADAAGPRSPRPSTVTTSRPPHSTPSTRHDSTGRPSSSTAQAPHSPSSHPCLVPQRFRSSRSTSSSVLYGVERDVVRLAVDGERDLRSLHGGSPVLRRRSRRSSRQSPRPAARRRDETTGPSSSARRERRGWPPPDRPARVRRAGCPPRPAPAPRARSGRASRRSRVRSRGGSASSSKCTADPWIWSITQSTWSTASVAQPPGDRPLRARRRVGARPGGDRGSGSGRRRGSRPCR